MCVHCLLPVGGSDFRRRGPHGWAPEFASRIEPSCGPSCRSYKWGRDEALRLFWFGESPVLLRMKPPSAPQLTFCT